MSKDFNVKRNNAVYIRMFLLSLLGVGVSVTYYVTQLTDASLVWMIVTSIVAVFFLGVLASSLRVLLNRKPALSITSEGIIDAISLAKGTTIPWKEIKSVKFENYLNNDHILIATHNPEKIIEKLTYMRKKMVSQQFQDTGAVIVINPKLIKAKPKELVEKLKKRARV